MKSQGLKKSKLPDAPGGDIFKQGKKILYIGKATSLRGRVRSYFSADLIETRGPRIVGMVTKADHISFQKTDSVLEALLLEAELIKKWGPPYNTEGKDGKSFNCVVITDEDFPRVLVARQKDVDSSIIHNSNFIIQASYGPFPHGSQLKVALKIIRKIFPWRDDKCIPFYIQRNSALGQRGSAGCRPCFNRQIGLCPGVCAGDISSREYKKQIRRLCLFLSGKVAKVSREIEREMKQFAKEQKFERAGKLKQQLFALKHIEDVALLKATNYSLRATHFRIEAYDLSHFGGKDIVGAMAVLESGEIRKSEYRLFKIRGTRGVHEVKGLEELLQRRFAHTEWRFPDLIVVDGNTVQKRAAEKTLLSLGRSIPVIALVKNERHRPRELLGDKEPGVKHRSEILLANSEAHRFALKFQRKRRRIA